MLRALLPLVLLSVAWVTDARADWPGRPKADPPQLHQDGPPPAWIETSSRSAWLAYGSYCWTTLCVDMIPPAMRKDIPTVSVRRDALVRVHLAFRPSKAQVLVIHGDRTNTYKLRAARVLTWRPRRAGVVLIDARGREGSAAYLLRLRVR
jgi:hypothetical protein